MRNDVTGIMKLTILDGSEVLCNVLAGTRPEILQKVQHFVGINRQ